MTTEAKVGIFVLACLAVLTSTLVYLLNAQFRRGGVHYRTYLRYAGGLEPGSAVLFGGINVGKVTAVQPWQSDPTRIEILMELKQGTPVNEKSAAKLGSVSLMSEPALAVSTGSNSARRLAPGATIPSAEALSLDEVAGKVAALTDNANGLVSQVKGEIGDISSDARKLLANLNAVTGQANQEQVALLLRQANGFLSDERPKVNHLTDQLTMLTEHADTVVNKTSPLVEHADHAIQNADATVTDLHDPIRKDLVDLQNTLDEAKGLLASLQVVVRANDSKIDDTIENLRIATDNLDQLTESLKQRPWSLIRIRQPEDRKVPQ